MWRRLILTAALAAHAGLIGGAAAAHRDPFAVRDPARVQGPPRVDWSAEIVKWLGGLGRWLWPLP